MGGTSVIDFKDVKYFYFLSFLEGILFYELEGEPIYYYDFYVKEIQQISNLNHYFTPGQFRNQTNQCVLVEMDKDFNQTYYLLNHKFEKTLLPQYPKFLFDDNFISYNGSCIENYSLSSHNTNWRIYIQEEEKVEKHNRDILKREGQIYCVWTGKKISTYDIEHMIPFSIWKNNDLWNLLPSDSKTNNQKRNKIPSSNLIEKRKDMILEYWQIINEHQAIRFQKEIQVALLGNSAFSLWKETAIPQLQRSCSYLIESRGFEEWDI